MNIGSTGNIEPVKVSVIVNNYNYANYLDACIGSILHQDYGNIEIVVVDDGSVDLSVKLLERYTDEIILIKKENGGQSSAINAGFSRCTGDIICFLDSDDYIFPEKIKLIAEEFKDPDVGMVLHDLQILTQESEKYNGRYYTEINDVSLLSGYVYQKVAKDFYNWHFPPTSGISISRKVAEVLFPFPEAGWEICVDTLIAYGAAYLSRVHVINQALGVYRLHDDNNFNRHSMNERPDAADVHKYFIRSSGVYNYLNKIKVLVNGPGVILPIENYYLYRNLCFLIARLDTGMLYSLIDNNINYHHSSTDKRWSRLILITKYIFIDMLIYFSLLLKLPTYRSKERIEFLNLIGKKPIESSSIKKAFIDLWPY